MRTEVRTIYITSDDEEFSDEHAAAVHELAEHMNSDVGHGLYLERWRFKELAEWLLQHYDMERIEAQEVEPSGDVRPTDVSQVVVVALDPLPDGDQPL